MKKQLWRIMTAGMGMSMLVLTACSAQPAGTVKIPDVVYVQNMDENQSENKISVTGRETVEVIPDMAQVSFSVRTEHKDAEKCQQENTEKLNGLLEYLKGLGYAEESLKTSGFYMNPRYDWSGSRQTLIGYEMSTTVTVSDVPIEESGQLLSNAVKNGANEIDSVQYFSSEYDDAYNRALAEAMALARGKAEMLAAASGQELGIVLHVQELGDSQSGRYVRGDVPAMKAMATESVNDAAAMDVMPGEMQISAEVSVEFSLGAATGE